MHPTRILPRHRQIAWHGARSWHRKYEELLNGIGADIKDDTTLAEVGATLTRLMPGAAPHPGWAQALHPSMALHYFERLLDLHHGDRTAVQYIRNVYNAVGQAPNTDRMTLFGAIVCAAIGAKLHRLLTDVVDDITNRWTATVVRRTGHGGAGWAGPNHGRLGRDQLAIISTALADLSVHMHIQPASSVLRDHHDAIETAVDDAGAAKLALEAIIAANP